MGWIVLVIGLLALPFLRRREKSKIGVEKESISSAVPKSTEAKTPDDITLSPEQQKLFDLLENTPDHYFITGKAGTGKSLVLEYFRKHTAKKIVLCAPTGICALQLKGQTIHTLFRLPISYIKKNSLSEDARASEVLAHVDTVVIDEISMVRADVMDAIDHRLRQTKKSDVPFGGVQMIMVGDVYQLPPVVNDKELERYFIENYGGYFFFQADVWRNARFSVYALKKVYRQKEAKFKALLNAVREGSITHEQLSQLNTRVHTSCPTGGVITLSPTNAVVNQINSSCLEVLDGDMYEYPAVITGLFDESFVPVEKFLRLKKGAQVIFVRNDKQNRWVNGSIGMVHALSESEVKVLLHGKIVSVPYETWEKIQYTYNTEINGIEEEVVSSFTQFPLRLAWAMTIHKSQGKTYDAVVLDMGNGAFAHGQAYVALSRCTSFKRLYLKTPLRQRDIIVDPAIRQFMQLHVENGVYSR